MKKCPFCAEEIQDEAIKCKHCGSTLKNKVVRFIEKESLANKEIWQKMWEGKPVLLKVFRTCCFIICGLIIVILCIPEAKQNGKEKEEYPHAWHVGDEVIIYHHDNISNVTYLDGTEISITFNDEDVHELIPIAANERTLWEIEEAMEDRDEPAIKALLERDGGSYYASGTKALILEMNFTNYRVRLLDGESRGYEGYINSLDDVLVIDRIKNKKRD